MSDPPKKFAPSLVTWLIFVGLAVLIVFALFQSPDGGSVTVPYSRFKTLLDKGQIETVVFRGDRISGAFHSAIEAMPGTT